MLKIQRKKPKKANKGKNCGLRVWWYELIFLNSVGDPDPQDPHVFGPPAPGSEPFLFWQRYRTDPDLAPDPSLFSKMC
jgi:hypothetical protein